MNWLVGTVGLTKITGSLSEYHDVLCDYTSEVVSLLSPQMVSLILAD